MMNKRLLKGTCAVFLAAGLTLLAPAPASAAGPVFAKQSVPETSAAGDVTVDGKLDEKAWSAALTLETVWDGEASMNPFRQLGDRVDASDLSATFKIMFQGQKFYIGAEVVDNCLTVYDSLKDAPEFEARLSTVWNNLQFDFDAIECFINLNAAGATGALTSPKPKPGYFEDGLQMAVRADKLYGYGSENDPGGTQPRSWCVKVGSPAADFSRDEALSVEFVAPTGEAPRAGTISYEICVDADKIEGLALTGGNSIYFLGYVKDLDTTTDLASPHDVEPPQGGAMLNRTGYWTNNLPAGSAPWRDMSVWEEFTLQGATSESP
jgi:hypothetical protein